MPRHLNERGQRCDVCKDILNLQGDCECCIRRDIKELKEGRHKLTAKQERNRGWAHPTKKPQMTDKERNLLASDAKHYPEMYS